MAVNFSGSMTANQWVNTSGKRLFLNAARDTVVEEGSPEAAYLLAAPGGMLPVAEAAKYGLVEGKTARDYLTPLQQEAEDSTEEHNFKAAAQKMRTQQHERGIYMTQDEAMAQVKKDAGKEEADAKPADAEVKSQAPASDKSVAGPDKTK